MTGIVASRVIVATHVSGRRQPTTALQREYRLVTYQGCQVGEREMAFSRGQIVFLVATLFAGSAMTCNAVLAEGALAVGVPAGGVVRGYAIGFALNAKSEAEARKVAIIACKKTKGSNAAAMAQCAVVVTFHNQCASSAMDPANGTPGAGWGVADTQQAADEKALARCRETAGADRRGFCKVLDHHCDGTAK